MATKKKATKSSKRSAKASTVRAGRTKSTKKVALKSTKKKVRATTKASALKKKAVTTKKKKKAVTKPTKKSASPTTKKKSVKKNVKKKAVVKARVTKKVVKRSKAPRSQTRTLKPESQEPIDRVPLTTAQLRKIKPGLTRYEIQAYRKLLLAKRLDIIGDVTTMQNDACNKNADGNLSHMPVHMADIGSDNYEQEFTLGMVESERRMLHQIINALQRIANRVYGVCEETGVPIGKPRLDAKPWARYCIEVAREKERRGQSA